MAATATQTQAVEQRSSWEADGVQQQQQTKDAVAQSQAHPRRYPGVGPEEEGATLGEAEEEAAREYRTPYPQHLGGKEYPGPREPQAAGQGRKTEKR